VEPLSPEPPKSSRYRPEGDEAVNPYRAPTAPGGSLKPLGSLAQSARLKQLNAARVIFCLIGAFFIGIHVYEYMNLDKIIDQQLQELIAQEVGPGMQVDQAKVDEVRQLMMTFATVADFVMIGIGVLYLLFALLVRKFPVTTTVVGLLLYLAYIGIFAFLQPMTLVQGYLIKIVIIVGLAKAIQAAFAYRAEERAMAAAEEYA
jgi:hypothetical protein